MKDRFFTTGSKRNSESIRLSEIIYISNGPVRGNIVVTRDNKKRCVDDSDYERLRHALGIKSI